MAVGKWHLTPRGERSPAGPFDRWPLGLGFERFYGFLQGDTNHWAPNLVADNHYIDPPRSPEDGYHLSEDLRSEEHTSELQSLMRNSYAVFCLTKTTTPINKQ